MNELSNGEIKAGAYLSQTQNKYDLDLFCRLNTEYASKPITPKPRQLTSGYRIDLAKKRAEQINKEVDLRHKRVIEVGCGGGELSRILADDYGCTVASLDIVEYPTWAELQNEKVEFMVFDLGTKDCLTEIEDKIGNQWDCIVSLVVWEHVKHPYTMLKNCYSLLKPNGFFYLRANLYRSAVASHLYRDIYFPWPHLLFSDEVFEKFYEKFGVGATGLTRPSWLNKVTYAQYLLYFKEIGFKVKKEKLKRRPIDEGFYERFEEKLSAYPRFDLALDFFDIVLTR